MGLLDDLLLSLSVQYDSAEWKPAFLSQARAFGAFGAVTLTRTSPHKQLHNKLPPSRITSI